MMVYTDQIGNKLAIEKIPLRIVSLVPSQSEFLWEIGIRRELVGITKFCVHPEEMFHKIERIGGTKSLNIDKIRQLKPDLIIGNKEENDREQIELLQQEFNVWMSDIYTFDEAFRMMEQVGKIVGKERESKEITMKLKTLLPPLHNLFSDKTVAYFIWNDPYMLAAGHTFIDHVLSYIGFTNAIPTAERYPEVNIEKLKKMNPDFCFLSSEPFPFNHKHCAELKKVLPGSNVVLVDGEMFSWYGSRLLKLPAYLKDLNEQLLAGRV